MAKSDPRDFRNALGQFATGVTVVTSADADGSPVGVTASSFNSVSLDPPLVLWSLAKSARSMPVYQRSGGFNVHVLAAHQISLSNQFARPGGDKFDGVDWKPCPRGHPVLPEYAALFRCETEYQYEGGDHDIFVGRVIEYDNRDLPALVFHAGRYADAKPKQAASAGDDGIDVESGRFTDDFLLYLISRAHFQSSYPTRLSCEQLGMSNPEYFCLSLLSMSGPLTEPEIISRLEHTGHHPDADIFARLIRKGWTDHHGDLMAISDLGREVFIGLLARSKAVEEQLTKHFTDEEIGQAKSFLKKLIRATRADIPELW